MASAATGAPPQKSYGCRGGVSGSPTMILRSVSVRPSRSAARRTTTGAFGSNGSGVGRRASIRSRRDTPRCAEEDVRLFARQVERQIPGIDGLARARHRPRRCGTAAWRAARPPIPSSGGCAPPTLRCAPSLTTL